MYLTASMKFSATPPAVVHPAARMATVLADALPAEIAPGVTPSTGAARRPSNRETILDAAEDVAVADGAAHLTLDAVAERAGVSKGGLLYHFPSKELLLEGLVDRQMARVEAMRLQALETLPPGPGRELRAFVLSATQKCVAQEERLGCGMLAAVANSPRLLEPVRAAHRRRLEWIAAGDPPLPFERAAAISLAVDGLCLLEMLQVSPYSADERRRILADLLLLVDETAERTAVTADLSLSQPN